MIDSLRVFICPCNSDASEHKMCWIRSLPKSIRYCYSYGCFHQRSCEHDHHGVLICLDCPVISDACPMAFINSRGCLRSSLIHRCSTIFPWIFPWISGCSNGFSNGSPHLQGFPNRPLGCPQPTQGADLRRWVWEVSSRYVESIQMEVSIAMGVSPKYMVCNGKSPSKMDDLGVPPFQETSK